jgi:hypothetical protein
MFNLQWQESGHPPFGFESGLFALILLILPPGSGLLPVLFRQKKRNCPSTRQTTALFLSFSFTYAQFRNFGFIGN